MPPIFGRLTQWHSKIILGTEGMPLPPHLPRPLALPAAPSPHHGQEALISLSASSLDTPTPGRGLRRRHFPWLRITGWTNTNHWHRVTYTPRPHWWCRVDHWGLLREYTSLGIAYDVESNTSSSAEEATEEPSPSTESDEVINSVRV